MNNKDIKDLLKKFREGTIDKEEKAFLENWVQYGEFTERELLDGELNRELNKISRRLPLEKTIKLWPRIAAAASIVMAIGAGIWFFNTYYLNGHYHEAGQDFAAAAADIAPGKNTATLTLANGKVINLSDAKSGVVIDASQITYNDGSLVQDSSGSHFSGSQKSDQKNTGPVGVPSLGTQKQFTVTTPRGGTYQIKLPDGTKVWLNAASTLTYSTDLKERGKVRKVQLSGEAYFEVFKDKKLPFIVKTKLQEVEVLGTHFNISAYTDENAVKTTLVEGSVKVVLLSPSGRDPFRERGKPERVLAPNQQAILSGSNQIAVNQVDVNEVIAWKNGLFSFNNAPMQSVMRQIARWYNVEVTYQDEGLKDKLLDGSVSRYDNISGILNAISQTGAARFKIEGNKITVIN